VTHVILMALAPVFFVMALGFAAGRMHAIDNRHVDSLNTLVMNFAVPASLFVAIGSAPRSEVLRQGSLFAIEGAVMLVVYLAWYALQRRVTGASRGEAATQALTVAFPNIAGVALPLVSAILGPAGAVSAAIALAAGAILVTPLTLVVLAPALGAALSLSGLGLDTVASASLRLIGQAAAGAALFLTGLVLSAQSLRLNPRIMGATLTGDVIRPLLVVAIVHLFAVPAAIGNVAILLAVVPSGFFGILFGLSHRQDSAEVGSMVLASTVFSIVTLAIAIAMLYPR
jgi:malonate transporter